MTALPYFFALFAPDCLLPERQRKKAVPAGFWLCGGGFSGPKKISCFCRILFTFQAFRVMYGHTGKHPEKNKAGKYPEKGNKNDGIHR